MNYKLQVKDLRKSYGPVVALASASIDLSEGECLTLLGPSGSGKTTLLTTVTGLVQPDAGEIWIDGRLATYLPPHQRDIGVVFQNYALFPHLSVYDNIAFPLRMRHVSEGQIRKRVNVALATVKLPDVGARWPRELSGGQQQRIALARCIVYHPSIILMDEPLGALDKKLRDHMQLEIKHLHNELGVTVLYVTHDQEEAMVLSDRICLMNDGQIVQVGTPQDLYFRPRSMFAASFLGESNIFPAEVLSIDGPRTSLRAAGDTIIQSQSSEGVSVGDKVSFMVRPEAIRVAERPPSHKNSMEMTLRDALVAGTVTKLYGVAKDGSTISVAQLTTRAGHAYGLGSAMHINWSADDTVILTK